MYKLKYSKSCKKRRLLLNKKKSFNKIKNLHLKKCIKSTYFK
ncbi:hypothetical protein AB837_00127 [bacterium AB1]|nr:hypothetical protein AB837_00127 [bacterium AB1]